MSVARPWRIVVLVAGMFMAVVGIAMLFAHMEHKSSDPWKSPELLQLKEQLRAEPRNEGLKTEIRELDLKLRQRYFRLLSFKASGVYLLFGGAAVFLIAATQVRQINRRPHLPRLNPLAAEQLATSRRQSRWALASCGMALVATFAAVAFGSKSPLPSDSAGVAKLFVESGNEAPPMAALDCATDEELRANWPGFRGFEGSGVTLASNVPVQLDEASALWKAAVPAPGFNSPIVFGDQVFFTGGDAQKREVFCLDAISGELRWRQAVANVPGSPPEVPEIPDMTGYCAPTAATDGRRVYAWFATGEIAAFTLDGLPVWSRHLGVPHNPYGQATSLRTWRDRVIVQFDQGEPEDRLSKLIALDGRTGRTLWEKPRPVGASWTTPIVISVRHASAEHERLAETPAPPTSDSAQIITLALPFVISYAAADGVELWRADVLDGEVTPSAVFAGGQVFAVSPSAKLMALRPDGSGDVTQSHVNWSIQEYLPDISSPASNGELVFTVTSSGLLACFDAKDGKKVWEHDFEFEVQASPAIAGGCLYLVGTHGEVVATSAAREFTELGRVSLDDEFYASPAFADGRMILRGNNNVWCFGEKMRTANAQ